MNLSLGHKIDDDRERAALLAYQRCLDQNAQRFIIEDVHHPDELEQVLHLLLSDVWPPSAYRIRHIIRSGVHLRFIPLSQPNNQQMIGEWIGNRSHGVVFVSAIRDLRDIGTRKFQ